MLVFRVIGKLLDALAFAVVLTILLLAGLMDILIWQPFKPKRKAPPAH